MTKFAKFNFKRGIEHGHEAASLMLALTAVISHEKIVCERKTESNRESHREEAKSISIHIPLGPLQPEAWEAIIGNS